MAIVAVLKDEPSADEERRMTESERFLVQGQPFDGMSGPQFIIQLWRDAEGKPQYFGPRHWWRREWVPPPQFVLHGIDEADFDALVKELERNATDRY